VASKSNSSFGVVKKIFSNRNIMAISSTNMLYQIFNNLWQIWWSVYLSEVLGVSATLIGLLSTIQNTSRILFQLPGGVMADRIGRKKVIIYGTTLRIIAPIFLLFARSWVWVIPGMVLNAVASIYMPAFNAMIAESLPVENRGQAYGAYRMVTSTPAMFMPLVSGFYLDVMGVGPAVRYGLMMFIVAAGVATAVRAKYLEETFIPSKKDQKQSFKETMSDMVSVFKAQPRTIWAMTAVGVIGSFAMRMTWSFLPLYATHSDYVNLTYGQYGFLQSLSMFISVPLYYISGIIADKYGRVPCIALARGLGPFDSFSLYGLRNYTHLIAAYGVIGVAQGLGGGRLRTGGNMGGPAWSALIADIVPPAERGKVLGLMGTLAGLISLPGGIIGGMIYDSNPSLLLLSGSILEALSIPIILLFIRDVQEKKE